MMSARLLDFKFGNAELAPFFRRNNMLFLQISVTQQGCSQLCIVLHHRCREFCFMILCFTYELWGFTSDLQPWFQIPSAWPVTETQNTTTQLSWIYREVTAAKGEHHSQSDERSVKVCEVTSQIKSAWLRPSTAGAPVMGTWGIVPTKFWPIILTLSQSGVGSDRAHHIDLSPSSFESYRCACATT